MLDDKAYFYWWLTTLSWSSPFKAHAFSKQLSSPILGPPISLRLPSSLFQDALSLRDLGHCPGIPRRMLDLPNILSPCWQLLGVYGSSRVPFWGEKGWHSLLQPVTPSITHSCSLHALSRMTRSSLLSLRCLVTLVGAGKEILFLLTKLDFVNQKAFRFLFVIFSYKIYLEICSSRPSLFSLDGNGSVYV